MIVVPVVAVVVRRLPWTSVAALAIVVPVVAELGVVAVSLEVAEVWSFDAHLGAVGAAGRM